MQDIDAPSVVTWLLVIVRGKAGPESVGVLSCQSIISLRDTIMLTLATDPVLTLCQSFRPRRC